MLLYPGTSSWSLHLQHPLSPSTSLPTVQTNPPAHGFSPKLINRSCKPSTYFICTSLNSTYAPGPTPDMAFNQVTATSLTPTRPAPSAPVKRDLQSGIATSGYTSTFTVGTSSPSSSSYNSSYSGIGGSPNRTSDGLANAQIVRCGVVSVKEDGLVSWLWRPKWLVLKDQTLSIHKNEVRR